MTVLKLVSSKRKFLKGVEVSLLCVTDVDKFEKIKNKAYDKFPDDGLWGSQKKRNKYILKKLLK